MKIGSGIGIEYIQENGGVAVPVYSTWNPARVAPNISLTNGNQSATKNATGTYGHFGGTCPKTTGKWAYRPRSPANVNGQMFGVCAGASDGAFPTDATFWTNDSPRFTDAITWYQSDATICFNFNGSGGGVGTVGSSFNGDLSSELAAQKIEILLDLISATPQFHVAKAGSIFYTRNLPAGRTWTPFGVGVFATTATIDSGGGGYTVSPTLSALGYQAWVE
jgi:hypothetical protein